MLETAGSHSDHLVSLQADLETAQAQVKALGEGSRGHEQIVKDLESRLRAGAEETLGARVELEGLEKQVQEMEEQLEVAKSATGPNEELQAQIAKLQQVCLRTDTSSRCRADASTGGYEHQRRSCCRKKRMGGQVQLCIR